MREFDADPVLRYTEEVCGQIRSKRARPYIERELADHIEDRKRSFTKEGIPEEEALQRAVSDMGDAVSVGQELDRIHRPKPEWSILFVTAVMLCMGAFAQHYLSVIAAEGDWAGKTAFYQYMAVMPLGIAALLGIYFADYTVLGRYPKRIYAGILLLCGALYLYNGQFFGFYGHNLNIRYQMVYLALLLIPAYGAVLYSYRNSGYKGILKCGVAAVLAVFVFGYAGQEFISVIFAMGGLVLISAAVAKGWFGVKKKKKAFALVYAPTLFSLLGFALIKQWRYGDQKNVFLDIIKSKIFIDPNTTDGFFISLVRGILKNAQFTGQGELGPMVKPGTAPEEILPIWWGDFSLTYLIHQWGLIAGVLTLAVFIFLMVKMVRATLKQKNALGFMVSLSAVTAIGIQCLLFFSANLGICFLTILPLPLMTFGQTSFIVNMALLGLLLSAYRNIDIVRDMPIEIKNC
ncbi:MAG TPA: permease prefix domain 1-containing protein [Bacillota bacterium]|nr:permease prefix domain 1-containing protein [Bacillota bacterium]